MSNTKDLKSVGAQALQNIKPPLSGDYLDAMEDAPEPTPEEAAALREQKIARIAQVLDRGVLNDKLQEILRSCVPKGRRGKFVRDSEGDVMRYQNLNYTFDVVKGATGLHATGDNRVRVGDLVLMTISEEDYSILEEIRRRTIRKKIGIGKQEYINLASRNSEGGVVPFDESHTTIG
jgi:hypothetical protein